MVIRKTELIRAARELNTVLGLDPQIAVNTLRIEALKKAVLEAAELIDPNDKINQRTISLLGDLRAEMTPPEKDVVPPEDKLEDDATEEKTETPEDEAPEDEAPEKSPAKREKTTISWSEALATAIQNTKGRAFDGEEIIGEAVIIYEAKNKTAVDSDRGARAQWHGVRYMLIHLGVITPVKKEGQRMICYIYQKNPEV